MKLADKITDERKKKGWSQEELAEKLGLSRQAVSKWESAGSIPDIQRIIQLSELFGVSTDYLLKEDDNDNVNEKNENNIYEKERTLRHVSRNEAENFLNMKSQTAPIIANATFMCIICPTVLILLASLSDGNIFGITENAAAGLGLVFLFVMIAVAVALFIMCGVRSSRMEHLEKDSFELEPGIAYAVKEKRDAYEGTFTRGTVTGVVLCILACVPLLVVALMEAPDWVCGCFTSLLLLLIATGVNILIRVGMIKGSFDTLLQEGEYTKDEKRMKRKTGALSTAYWCLVTAIYLGWSLWTMLWDFTWIVWPVAGILFVALSAIIRFKYYPKR